MTIEHSPYSNWAVWINRTDEEHECDCDDEPEPEIVAVPVFVNPIVAFTVRPLLAGFAAMATPDARGWATAYDAAAVWLRYTPIDPVGNQVLSLVYEPHPQQSLRLQKTVLGLPKGATFEVGFFLLDEEDVEIFASPKIEVKTLARV